MARECEARGFNAGVSGHMSTRASQNRRCKNRMSVLSTPSDSAGPGAPFSFAQHRLEDLPTLNPSRAQHRTSQATAKMTTHLSPMALEPHTLGGMSRETGQQWISLERKPREHALTNTISSENTGPGPVGQQQEEKSHHPSPPS